MAQRRMFSLSVVDSDAFLDLPLSTQALYFHLNMRADDDGFIGNPKKIARLIGSSEDDLKLLIMKRFIIVFDDGVIVIKHWRMHNTIRKDRYTRTTYIEDLNALHIKENGSYTFDEAKAIERAIESVNQMAASWQPNGNHGNPGKVRLGKDNKEISSYEDIKKNSESSKQDGKENENEIPEVEKPKAKKPKKNKYGDYSHVLLTEDEYKKLLAEYPNAEEIIQFLDSYIEEKGYKAQSHYLSIKRWVVNAVNDQHRKGGKSYMHTSSMPDYMNNLSSQQDVKPASSKEIDEVNSLLEEMRNVHG